MRWFTLFSMDKVSDKLVLVVMFAAWLGRV